MPRAARVPRAPRLANGPESFETFMDDFVGAFARNHPVSATFMGLHDHDHRLPRGESEKPSRLRELSQLERRAADFNEATLSTSESCDRCVAEGAIQIERWELESEFTLRNPSLVIGESVFGLVSLLLRDFDDWGKRAESLVARLNDFEPALDEFCGMSKTMPIPAAWVGRARREVEGTRRLIQDGLPAVFVETPSSGLASTWESASRGALEALERFDEHLEAAPDSDDYAASETALALIIAEGHFLPESPEALLAEAESVLEESERCLDEGARRLGAEHWREPIAKLARLHPSNDAYFEEFDRVWGDAKSLAEQENLVSWPEFPIRYVPVPEWARTAAPHLYFLPYRSPPPFDEQTGVDYLTPSIDSSWDAAETNRFLERVNDSVIKLNHVVHHGGLGHHVQNFYASRASSRFGRIAAVDTAARIAFIAGGTMAEGWACYATELMDEIGFLTPLESFSQHHAKARMAARAIVDIRLHCEDISFEEAARFYIERTAMSEAAARSEVTKNSMFPGAALMYLFGVRGIRALRGEAEKRWAAEFSLKRFHDRLLSFGSLPVAMIAEVFFDD